MDYTLATPNVLIGGNFYYDLNISLKKTLLLGFSLFDSVLGPLLTGQGTTNSYTQICLTNVAFTSNVTQNFDKQLTLNELIKYYFSLDNIGVVEKVSEPLNFKNFQRSIKLKEKKYKAPLS